MATDRTFIDKYDSFVFTVRKIIYYGDTSTSTQPTNPKHDRWRFINYFGYDINHEYYDSKQDTFDFDNDDRLKDEFASIFSYRSLNVLQLGDICTIFSNLNDEKQTAEQLSGTRSLKNINRRLEDNEELVRSGSVLVSGKSKCRYTKNVDLLDGISDRQRFVEALDFAIKKNPFSAFASSYKRLVVNRDVLEDKSCQIQIDNQLFHPILDEMHIWELVSAISESKKISIEYCNSFVDATKLVSFKDLVALKLVYDSLYGRTYLYCVNADNKPYTFRLDRIFKIELGDSVSYNDYDGIKKELESMLDTAWLASIENDKIHHVKIRFNNHPSVKARVMNEMRHGKITEQNDDYFIFEIDVNNFVEMINWVLTYGSNATVLEPREMVDKVIEHLEVMSK